MTCRRRRPFRPFTVELVTGERMTVRHPEALRLRKDLAAFVEPDGFRRYFDAASVCQVFAEAVPAR